MCGKQICNLPDQFHTRGDQQSVSEEGSCFNNDESSTFTVPHVEV